MEAKPRTADYFKDDDGTEPVNEWLKTLKKKKKFVEHGKIITRIDRAELGNFGDHRILGGNWGEMRIDFGPGYRVYFGIDGDEIILLLHGGTKEDQQEDIKLAEERWNRYLKNKKENTNGK
jgi:putative addiction module killer protein